MTIQLPDTPREPVAETIGGFSFEDAYQWLEPEDDRTAAWQAAQRDVATAHLHAIPALDEIRALVAELSVDVRVSPPRPFGGRWFRMVLRPGDEQPVLVVGDEPGAEDDVLLDPNALAVERGIAVGLDWWYPSPDARYVAFGLSEGGSEQSVLHVLDVASGEWLPERIAGTTHCAVAWLPDGSGFFFNGFGDGATAGGMRIWRHTVGEAPATVAEDIDLQGAFLPVAQVAADGRHVFVNIGHYQFRPGAVLDLDRTDAGWQPFLTEVGGHCLGDVVGDRYVALCTEGSPLGRIVSIPLDAPGDRLQWRCVVAESDVVIRSLAFAGGGRLVLSELLDGVQRVRFVTSDGADAGELPKPGDGAVLSGGQSANATLPWESFVVASPRTPVVTFVHSAVSSSPSVWSYDIDARVLTPITKPAVQVDGIVTRQLVATAADGTKVPMTLVHRGDLDLSVPQPTLLDGYGGFNVVFFASYSPEYLAWVRRGGVYALVHLRGDGHYGEVSWQGGRRENKQRTFDDLYAAAERLVADGVTTPSQLGVRGGSNGGLLTGVAVTQRPELWGAVVSVVPVYDLLRGTQDPLTGYVIVNEFGNPWVAEECAWTAPYSPYHNVRDGIAYPPTLVVAGDRDMRCPPWHARKFAARLQEAQAGDAPILLQVQLEAGHGPGKPTTAKIDEASERLAFVEHHLRRGGEAR